MDPLYLFPSSKTEMQAVGIKTALACILFGFSSLGPGGHFQADEGVSLRRDAGGHFAAEFPNSREKAKNAIFAKKQVMFYGSSNGIDIPNLHLYPFRNLNEETKALAKGLFGAYVEKSNALIIVGENNNQSAVFGFLIIRGINITHSPYFEYLRSNTVEFGGKDCTEEFYQIKCYKIVDWAIDSVVKTDSNLLSVFNQIAAIYASANKVVIIWMEHGNELKFYPIKAMSDLRLINQSFARYFTDYMLSL